MKITAVLLVIIIGVTLSSACAPVEPTGTATPMEIVRLTPYYTATFTPTITPTPEGLPTSTPAPTATPTPRVYKVQANDTMIGIAYYFGLTLAELQAANPGIQPALLSIGTELIIPATAAAAATATVTAPLAYAVTLREPVCVLSLTGGYHCYALVMNEEDFVLENLVAEITLTDPTGDETITRQVELPLKQLAASAAIPFYTYFAPPVFADARVTAEILTVTKVNDEDSKISPLVIEGTEVVIAADGVSAAVSGKAKLQVEGTAAGRYTLAAVAYNAQGRVVGLRRTSEETGWGDSGEIEFSIMVYSTSGSIDRVEVFGEAE